jgi:hypothetical protein
MKFLLRYCLEISFEGGKILPKQLQQQPETIMAWVRSRDEKR